MAGHYLGHVDWRDPLFQYLRWEIFPQQGANADDGIRVFRLNGSNAVYLYEDRSTNRKVIGKFFRSELMSDWNAARRRLNREYGNLHEIRRYLSHPHYVARPLGKNDDLGCLLVVEYCEGESLDAVIEQAIKYHQRDKLYAKLTALGYFLASAHNNSAGSDKVNFNDNIIYMNHMLNLLSQQNLLGQWEKDELFYCRDRWRDKEEMWSDNQVFVHGDATPSNFLFGDGLHVVSFDLERGHWTDRVFDVGRVAGELLHFFLLNCDNKYAAEPFIGHFLWEYSCHFPNRDAAFYAITRRVPFYLGLTLLRIARNTYLKWEYRRKLIENGKECLRRF